MEAAERKAADLERKLSGGAAPGAPAAPAAPATPAAPAATETGASKIRTPDDLKKAIEGLGAEPDRTKDLAGNLIYTAQKNSYTNEYLTNQLEQRNENERHTTMINAAKQEIEGIKESYRKTNPDFDNAFNHGKTAYVAAVKALMPKYTESQINQLFETEVLNLGLKAAREGTNLGDVLYDMAIDRFGYQPQDGGASPARAPANGARHPAKPNLRIVNANQRRAASPLDTGARGSGSRITLEQAANMTPGELMALSAEDIAYLETQGF